MKRTEYFYHTIFPVSEHFDCIPDENIIKTAQLKLRFDVQILRDVGFTPEKFVVNCFSVS
jgi:hypothetical protein